VYKRQRGLGDVYKRQALAREDELRAVLRDWVAAREKLDGAGESDCAERANVLLDGRK
jgi:hypothetical protein